MRLINRERVSTRHAILNSIFRRQLSGRAWLSDPDVFFLRDDNLKLSEREKYILSAVNSLFGGVLLCSDNMGEYDGEKLVHSSGVDGVKFYSLPPRLSQERVSCRSCLGEAEAKVTTLMEVRTGHQPKVAAP